MEGGLEMLLNDCISLVRDFDNVVVYACFLVNLTQARYIYVSHSNDILDVHRFEFLDVFSSREVADEQ
jgi:hypothetical protein